MTIRKITAYLLGALICLSAFVVIVLTCFEWGAFDESAYARAQQQYKIPETTGISQSDLKLVTHKLLAYCKGQYKLLEVKATVNGVYREVFDGREKAHMVDVQKLFLAGYDIRNGCLLAVLLLVTILVSVSRKNIYGVLARSWLVTVAVLGLAGTALGIYMMSDINHFDKVFTQFHLMLFTNDLWQLDPDTEVLIQMLPEEFFFSLVRTIVTAAGVSLAVVTAGAVAVQCLCRRHSRLKAEKEPGQEHVPD
jgi:integral membrane protein (TIGR01906 family)